MKNILVTGGLGFIGSQFIREMVKTRPEINIINYDKVAYAANVDLIDSFASISQYRFVKGDICDQNLIEDVFKEYNIQGVVHFAAESHVDNSITGPRPFFETNIMGTLSLLEVARKYWMSHPFEAKEGFEDSRFHHVSTDEVFGSLEAGDLFSEDSPYRPNNPYSASKAGSDFLARSYIKTFGLNIVLTNCSNNFGPWQNDEKLIPTVIKNAVNLNPIPIYGDGKNIRDWLYVGDHAKAVQLVFEKGKKGETYNVGTRNEMTNFDLCCVLCEILDELKPREDGKTYSELITFVKDRPGHDQRYAIDPQKIETELGFKANFDFKLALIETVGWYLKKWSL